MFKYLNIVTGVLVYFERKDLYVSKEPHMLDKKSPYVVLSEGFSSPYVEKAPYVANQLPICGPYVSAPVVIWGMQKRDMQQIPENETRTPTTNGEDDR